MKNKSLRHADLGGESPQVRFAPGRALVLPLVLLLSTAYVSGTPSVTTLGGGPSAGFLNSSNTLGSLFNTPMGLAFSPSGNWLFVADSGNNAIRRLDLSAHQTITFTTTGLSQPTGVAVDGAGHVYVLNSGNGTLLEFDQFGDPLATLASGLANANGITMDGSTNIFITANGTDVIRITPAGAQSTVVSIPDASALLKGIAALNDGTLAVADAGRNGILIVNPALGTVNNLSGFNGAGDHFGTSNNAQFNQPNGIAAAAGGMLVVADSGNNRVKVVDPQGTVTNLYGVASSFWVTGPGTFPGWWDGLVCPAPDINYNCSGYAEARLPAGVVVAADGSVYSTEDFYHLVRHVTDTGLAGTGGGGTGGGTNLVVTAPTIISPTSGYYPMGRLIQVSSPNPNVRYTTDGTEPTTNSLAAIMNGNSGVIHWFNSTNDLSFLRVKAFVGTNGSTTVSGQAVSANDIGTPPGPSADGAIWGGIGSTIVVPVVADLRPSDQVKSYQFRVEVAPNGAAPMIGSGYNALDISSNDFVQLATAVQGQGSTTGKISVLSYTIGTTAGLQVTAIGNSGNISFQKYAVVALLKVPIPPNANEGDTYSLSVSYPSATSDGINSPVGLTPMAAATILVKDVPYTVGDSASLYGGWYNAGTFGDDDLENADVNNAFYAALGLRVPYAFSDVFNAMDAYPPDAPGFIGGDGQIRFLDWQVILRRSLRLDTNDWARSWSPGGTLVNTRTNLIQRPLFQSPSPQISSPWYRQVLLGGVSVGNVPQGGLVNVPVYVKLADNSTLSGLQFRAVVDPLNGAPGLTQPPQLIVAPGSVNPSMEQSTQPNATAFGWSLGAFSFQSRSSNFIGWLQFSLPAGSFGQYALSFANADGAPDLNTQYNFETRSAYVAVNATAPPASICSDEWKVYFFGSLTNPSATDFADPDGDGVPNWMEFIAGTDPTDPSSKLQFTSAERRVVNNQLQTVLHWLTAPGKAYEVQWSGSPVGGIWNILGTVSGNGVATAYADPSNSAGARYYRLHILP